MADESLLDSVKDIYFDLGSPASFGGVLAVQKELKKKGIRIPLPKLRILLHRIDTYTSFFKGAKKGAQRHTYAPCIDWEWFADRYILSTTSSSSRFSFYLQNYASKNKGVKFAVVLVDALSLQTFIVPVKALKAKNVAVALDALFSTTQRVPQSFCKWFCRLCHPKITLTPVQTQIMAQNGWVTQKLCSKS